MPLCTNAITLLRATLGDFGPTQLYSDERLQEALCIAAFFVVGDIGLSGYTVNLSDFTVVPDLEGDELALVVLRAVCLLDGGEARQGARNSISVKDGPSSVDMRGRGNDLMRVGESSCSKYEAAKRDYRLGIPVGRLISSPYGVGQSERGYR